MLNPVFANVYIAEITKVTFDEEGNETERELIEELEEECSDNDEMFEIAYERKVELMEELPSADWDAYDFEIKIYGIGTRPVGFWDEDWEF